MAAPSTLKDLLLSTTTFKVNVEEIASQLELSSYEAASRYLLSKGFEIPPTILQEAVQVGMAEARANMMDFFGKQNQFLTVTKKGTRASPSPCSVRTPAPAASGVSVSAGGSGDSGLSDSLTSNLPTVDEGAVKPKRWNYPLEHAPKATSVQMLCAMYKKELMVTLGQQYGLELDSKSSQGEMANLLFSAIQETKVEPIGEGWEQI